MDVCCNSEMNNTFFTTYEGTVIKESFVSLDCDKDVNGGCENTDDDELTFVVVDGLLMVYGSDSDLAGLDLEAYFDEDMSAFLIGEMPEGVDFYLYDGKLIILTD